MCLVESMLGAEPLATWKNQLGMRFVRIPAGEFEMGSPTTEAGRKSNEALRKTRIKYPFYLGVTEVTQAQWKAIMGSNPSYRKGPSLPVETVTWREAFEFCRRLTAKEGRIYRLPSESEWEWACRAGKKGAFQSEIDKHAWTRENATRLMPVARLAPNAWGLFDMQGNVAEWCSDIYSDRQGKTYRSQRVTKGGSFYHPPFSARPSARLPIESEEGMTIGTAFNGFRVLCENPH